MLLVIKYNTVFIYFVRGYENVITKYIVNYGRKNQY